MNRLVPSMLAVIFFCCKPAARVAAPVVPRGGFPLSEVFTGNLNPVDEKYRLLGVVSVGVKPERTNYLFDERDAYYTLSPDRRRAVGMFVNRNVSFEAHIDISGVDLSRCDTLRNMADPGEPFVLKALKDGRPVGYVRAADARIRLEYIGRTVSGGIMSDCVLTGRMHYFNGVDTVQCPVHMKLFHIPFEKGLGSRESKGGGYEPGIDSASVTVP